MVRQNTELQNQSWEKIKVIFTTFIIIPLNPAGCVVVAAVPNPPKPTI